MNFWTVMFVSTNSMLCIRLLFFSDRDRQESRWGYRLLLFLTSIYVAHQVIDVAFHPNQFVSPFVAIMHAALLLAAMVMRPEYLPGNTDYATTKQTYRRLGHSLAWRWHRLWHSRVYLQDGKTRRPGR